MKIRNYGILSSRNKTKCLTQLYEYFELDAYQKPPSLLFVEVGIGLWCKAVNLQTLWRKNDTDRLESKAQGQP
jgi:hypothetical protein